MWIFQMIPMTWSIPHRHSTESRRASDMPGCSLCSKEAVCSRDSPTTLIAPRTTQRSPRKWTGYTLNIIILFIIKSLLFRQNTARNRRYSGQRPQKNTASQISDTPFSTGRAPFPQANTAYCSGPIPTTLR